jgi:hypothetical protein
MRIAAAVRLLIAAAVLGLFRTSAYDRASHPEDWVMMIRWRLRLSICVLMLVPSFAWAGKPNWAKKGVGFSGDCKSDCRPQRIIAPDKKSVIEVLYHDGAAYLRVSAPDQPPREIHDAFNSPRNDLLWAPDSKAFFVDGGAGMTSPAYVQVYLVEDAQLRPLDVTQQAEQDMVKSFPPCKALYLDQAACRKMETRPGYNLTAIDWADDSSALVVMAEIPCTSNFGGIMCQVLGYELEVPSGKILNRMEPRELKAEWQKSMVQRFMIPEQPQYQN